MYRKKCKKAINIIVVFFLLFASIFGNNAFGLNINDTNSTEIKMIAAGKRHSLALKEDGILWAWGHNDYWQLGDGFNVDRLVPVKVLASVKSVAAGYDHSCAIKEDGTVWSWGGIMLVRLEMEPIYPEKFL